MKSFSVDESHDIVIVNGVLQLAEGAELKRQSAECTLNTKKGEWFFDEESGIDSDALLGKKDLDNETIKDVLMDGLTQVDETFTIQQITKDYNKRNRKLKVGCTATTESGDTITLTDVWSR